MDNEAILELPLQGRQVTDLLVLSGAAVQTAQVTSRGFPGGVNISVAGGLPAPELFDVEGLRSAAQLVLRHPGQADLVQRLTVEPQFACNSTHGLTPPLLLGRRPMDQASGWPAGAMCPFAG